MEGGEPFSICKFAGMSMSGGVLVLEAASERGLVMRGDRQKQLIKCSTRSVAPSPQLKRLSAPGISYNTKHNEIVIYQYAAPQKQHLDD